MSGFSASADSQAGAFRSDIEGLRAIAVGAVLLFHAGFGFAKGGYVGVDVFFVISGFLITGLLLREVDGSGTVSMARFYARRIRRLLPASVTTLLFTTVLTLVALPPNRWAAIAGDVIGSAFYVVNWRFAARSVDYLTAESAASPVQHFWSLAVEEQYYLLWPALILLGVLAAKKAGWSFRAAIGGALALLGTASLVYSITYTTSNPGAAYFVTTTRIWELAIGAGIALLARRLQSIPKSIAGPVGWVGLAAISLAVVTFGEDTSFPSYTALLPTVGTALVIVAGTGSRSTSIYRALSVKPALFVGKLSYSLYLYHWPLIVVLDFIYGGITPLTGTVGIVLSFAPAYLSYRFIETPFREARSFVSPPSRGLRYGFAMTGLAALFGASILGVIAIGESSQPAQALSEPGNEAQRDPGSAVQDLDEVLVAVLAESDVPGEIPAGLNPPLTSAADDNGDVWELGCHQDQTHAEPLSCDFGDESGPVVALIGDSHAVHWVPAMELVALDQGWLLRSYTKSACPIGLMTIGVGGEYNESCLAWNENLLDELIDSRPDAVIVTSSTTNLPIDPDGSELPREERMARYMEGLGRSVEALVEAGIDVILMADTPRPPEDIPECLAREQDVEPCSRPRDEALVPDFQYQVAQDMGLPFIDMIDYICTPTVCPPIVANMVVWHDNSHLTATYARHIAPALGRELPLP